MKFIKPGKVAVVLQGRYAGKKVVIIKQFDEGTPERPYGHALVAGIDQYPRKITNAMNAKKIQKRSRVKPFVKVVNYNHLMPTRYTFELEELKKLVTADKVAEPSQRIETRKVVRKQFEDRYNAGKNKWFFTKLRF
ncbi:MAG: 60S ribosomal protein l27-like protein [Piptocephalis tieghemiana]|nr:MAG: 60S ribosomal protein l27-like protein [Piptocephalis tieghemiana]